MASLEEQIKERARELGFDHAGIAVAAAAETFAEFQSWLDAGHAGDMGYLHRHAEARRHPQSIFPEVRSVVMVALNCKQAAEPATTNRGRVAQYAQGRDYHDVLRARLKRLLADIAELVPGCRGRAVVDTAPLLERDFARRAGLGWFGKNTMLLNKRLGSHFFLGALLLNVPLIADSPFTSNHCGTCTACLDACPTAAFPAPGVLDARRCISYLTIELRGSIPGTLRQDMGDWLFGCDICQEVCPWNRKPAATTVPEFSRQDGDPLELIALLKLSEQEFRERFRGTAILRTGRNGLRRNAIIVLANQQDRTALSVLRELLMDDDAVIRETAEWAIGQLTPRKEGAAQV